MLTSFFCILRKILKNIIDIFSLFLYNIKGDLCDNAFELMAPRIFTCHLHDNNGYSDQHSVPGNGNVNWEELAEKLLNHAPQLISLQTEAKVFAEGLSFSEIVKRYRKYFPVQA